MLNDKETYFECGRKVAEARKNHDAGLSSHLLRWFHEAYALEEQKERMEVQEAFNEGYRS